MTRSKSQRIVRASLVVTLALGSLTAILDVAWRPVYEAASVDGILTPEELRDKKLIEVVDRTHRYNDAHDEGRVPFFLLGALTATASLVGLVAWPSEPAGGGKESG